MNDKRCVSRFRREVKVQEQSKLIFLICYVLIFQANGPLFRSCTTKFSPYVPYCATEVDAATKVATEYSNCKKLGRFANWQRGEYPAKYCTCFRPMSTEDKKLQEMCSLFLERSVPSWRWMLLRRSLFWYAVVRNRGRKPDLHRSSRSNQLGLLQWNLWYDLLKHFTGEAKIHFVLLF